MSDLGDVGVNQTAAEWFGGKGKTRHQSDNTIYLPGGLVDPANQLIDILSGYDAVSQQQLLELLSVWLATRTKNAADASVIADAMHKHIRQMIPQWLAHDRRTA